MGNVGVGLRLLQQGGSNSDGLVIAGAVVLLLVLLYLLLRSEEKVDWEVKTIYSNLSPQEFEELVADLWEDGGFSVEQTNDGGGDGGVDVFGSKRGVSVAIEVKRYQPGNTVGRPVVQKAVAACQQYGQSKAVIVTTSSFTDPAYEARDQFRSNTDVAVELVDGGEIIDRLEDSSLTPEDYLS